MMLFVVIANLLHEFGAPQWSVAVAAVLLLLTAVFALRETFSPAWLRRERVLDAQYRADMRQRIDALSSDERQAVLRNIAGDHPCRSCH
jgi:hypothetical protein